MQKLQTIIAKVHRELEAALRESNADANNTVLVADRITLSLGFCMRNESDGDLVFDCAKQSGAPDANNRITIEFVLRNKEGDPTEPIALSNKKETLDAREATRLTGILSDVFGSPGFDSAARASVFRDVLTELSPAQAQSVLKVLNGDTSPADDTTIRHALFRIQRMLERAPIGPVQGKEKLLSVLNHFSLEPVLELVQNKWKAQEDWLH